MAKLLPPLFDIRISKRILYLNATEEINDATWGAWFGEIQQALRSSSWDSQPFSLCKINLSRCPWADPQPLLSLGITLGEFEKNGGKTEVFFPAVDHRRTSSKANRFLKFLAREGFLDLFTGGNCIDIPKSSVINAVKSRTVYIGKETLNNDIISNLMDLPVPLAYERSTCLPATLLHIGHPDGKDNKSVLDDLDDWVERQLIKTIDPVVSDMAPGWAQRGVRYRLLMALRETLHNVAEHAYTEAGFAAVYIRYREGALGEAPGTWSRLTKFLKRESDTTKIPLMGGPTGKESYSKTRTGFFELFVIDSGQGLCNSFNESNLHKIMLDVFDKGRSRKGDNRPTKYGGLYLIRQLLEPVRDYIRACDKDTWWGTELPLKKTEAGSQPFGEFTMHARGVEHAHKGIEGLAWTIRCSWLERTDIAGPEQPWQGLILDSDRDYRNAVADILKSEETTHVRLDNYNTPGFSDRRLSLVSS